MSATSSPARSVGLREAVVWALAHAVNDGYPTLYLALLPLLMVRWHFSVSQAGLLAGLSALTTQALQPLLGWWSDRRGGPWFIVGGLAVGSVGSALGLAWSPSYAVFAGTLMVAGLGNAAFHPHMAALVTQSAPGRKGRQMGGWMVSGMIGHALAPLAAVAAFRWGGHLGLAVLALPGLLAAMALLGSARALARPQRPRRDPRIWAAAWQHGRAFFLMVVLRNLGTASLLTLLPILWHQRGGTLPETGALLTVVYGAGTVGNLLGGSLSDRLGSRWVLGGSLVVATLTAAGWAAAAGTGPLFWILVAGWGFSVNGAGAVMLVYGQDLFPGRAGMASGLTMGWGNAVGAFGAWAIGELAQTRGMTLAMTVAAVCLAAAIGPTFRVAGLSRARVGHKR